MMIRKYFAMFAAIAVMVTSIPVVPIYAEEAVSADIAEEDQKDISGGEDEDKDAQNGNKGSQDEEGSSANEDANAPSFADEDVKTDSDSDDDSVSENKAEDKSVSGDSVSDDSTVTTIDEENKTVSSGNASYTLKYYEINDNELEVTGYTGTAEGELIIPAEANGKPVVAIGNRAFEGCKGFTGNLTIPSSVTKVDGMAFYGCDGFTSLTISDGVSEIGQYAFEECKGFSGSLTIPASVRKIGNEAFCGCDGFTSLTISDGVLEIGQYAFSGCSSFTGKLSIPTSVTFLGSSAFSNCCGFTGSLTLPYGIEKIGSEAFNGCSGFTGKLTIPSSVISIGDSAFKNCNGFTGSLTVPSSVTDLGDQAFYNCSGFSSLKIPSSVTRVSDGVFAGCTGVSTLENNSKVKLSAWCYYSKDYWSDGPYDDTYFVNDNNPEDRVNRNYGSFANGSYTRRTPDANCDYKYIINKSGQLEITGYNTTPLGTLNIPEKIDGKTVEAIGSGAFRDCIGIDNIFIPDAVTSIGAEAFSGCNCATTLILPKKLKTIGNGAFSNCNNLKGDLSIPSDVTSIGSSAFRNCSGFKGSLTIPSGITVIEYGAFSGCNGFTGLSIPETVTSIGDEAFFCCSGFTGTLTIPASLTTIGDSAFYDCSGFTGSLTIPSSVTSIGYEAFSGCSGFKGSLIIPASVTSIGEGAFSGCSGFTGSLIIPTSVTSLGESVFSGCSGFTGKVPLSPYFDDKMEIPSDLFSGCTGFTSISIPSNVRIIHSGAFSGCKGLKGNLVIPQGMRRIEGAAFSDCTGFTGTLSIPNALEEMEGRPFLGMYEVAKIINGSDIEIPAEAFIPSYDKSFFTNSSGKRVYRDGAIGKGTFIKKQATTNIILNKTSITLHPGDSFTLKATVEPANAANKKIKWSSSNKKAVTVSSTGVIKAVAEKGNYYYSVKITAKAADGNSEATCWVSVEPIHVRSVTLDRKSVSIGKGDTFKLKVFVNPSNATDKSVYYYTNNSGVATVTEKGVVKGVGKGKATISVYADGVRATCNVTVKNPVKIESVELRKSASVYKGYTVTLKPTIKPSNAANNCMTWKSSNTKVATVSSTGVVKGIKAGTVKITATTMDGTKKSATCTMSVKNPILVKSVELNKTKVTVKKGKTVQLKATVSPSNATNKEVTWTSSNKKIATVDKNGKVKGIKAGTVEIAATANDGSKKKATCSVTVK